MIRVLFIALLLGMVSCMPVKQTEGVQKLQNKHIEKCHGSDHRHNSRSDHKNGCNSK